MKQQKKVLGVYETGSRHTVGDGFAVRNLFPSNGVVGQINPFLMLDYAGPTAFPPSDHQRGVDEHPHRGFETVSIAYQGAFEHRDSAGNSGTIRAGDVQWMTAGSGVVHEEKHEREFAQNGGTSELVQLWVNLPKTHKMTTPRYQAILNEEIPVVELAPGASARIIAGQLNGVAGRAKTVTPLNVFDLRAGAGSRFELELPSGHNAGLILLRGDVVVNDADVLKGEAQMATLTPVGEFVTIHANADSLLLVLSGEPINEPVASYGPFVMNTQLEIRQAFDDYRAGRMGHLQ